MHTVGQQGSVARRLADAIRNGRIASTHHVEDWAAALRQVGA